MTYNSVSQVRMTGFVTWPPLDIYNNFGTKKWPSDKASHTCDNMLYTIVCHSRSH